MTHDDHPLQSEASMSRDAVELLTVKQVAERLGIGKTLAYSLVADGRLPSHRIGGAIRVRPADLERFLIGTRVGPGREGPTPAAPRPRRGRSDDGPYPFI
jgi:excisionase family DNA binding protein